MDENKNKNQTFQTESKSTKNLKIVEVSKKKEITIWV